MILVTGGTGFLGSTLLRHLLADGNKIRAIKRQSSTVPPDLLDHPNLQWWEADISNYFELEDAFTNVTAVYHCAAMISFEPRDKKKIISINRNSTAHIVNLCIQYGARLLYVSSVAAIGKPKPSQKMADETDLWEFDGTQHGYAISKYEAEMEVWRGTVEGLDAVIINPSLIIGHQSGPENTGAIFKLLKSGLRYYAGGSVGLVDVEDVARAAIILMNSKDIQAERFIINNQNMSYQQLFSVCATYLGRPAPNRLATRNMLGIAWRAAKVLSWFTGKQPGLTRDTARAACEKQAYSNAKLKEKVGYAFKPIDQTLKEICAHI
ncbi:NAD-dependent epimerase/dehydratase family protein [Olivibacter sp. XZL3]|uniref:NAD-dependent epimerase/dehydratase family protein n=1 Tax=Olivibacter sp. XZL3 TaxID=1735116 RepID=UPI001066147E|nr:NAD-dependent epimerase/dehydratase family protein [Olivibacter sp. XZL3]